MGLLSGIAKFGKSIISKVAPKIVPGGSLLKGAVSVGAKLAKRVGRKNLKKIAGAVGGAAVVGGLAAAGGGGGGGGSAGMMIDPATGAVIRGGGRRRINPGNVKAMRRAIRRVEMGARLYSKMFRISRGKSIKGAPGVKVVRFKKRAA